MARTNARGEFTFIAPITPGLYFLFAGAPHYGKLLQTTFGRTVVVYRPGDQVRDIVIPAIPAAGLSGHVYGTDGHPISGCDVSAITRDNQHPDEFVELQVRRVSSFTFGIVEGDDSNRFLNVHRVQTGADGSYTFRDLGADRYFVLAGCRERVRPGNYPQSIWEPLAYPQATSIAKAQEILLLPGKHRSGIDFHLQRKRSYAFEGKVIFSDGSPPKSSSEAIYSHDLQILRSDRALTSIGPRPEACNWDANTGNFACYSLLPGTYTLYFDLSSGFGAAYKIPSQFARITYTVQANAKPQPLTVQLHNVPSERSQTPTTGPTGSLELRKVCGAAVAEKPQIQVLSWGHGHELAQCYVLSYFGGTRLSLPEDTYTVSAFEASFAPRNSHLGEQSKFEGVLMQRGVRVHIRAGEKSEPVLPVLTTSDLIDIGLQSLRPDQ